MKLKHEKCLFLPSEVEYPGHVINCPGLQPSEAEIAAVTRTPAPTNETEVKFFLDFVSYCTVFCLILPLFLFYHVK